MATREDWALVAVEAAAMACSSLINPCMLAVIAVVFGAEASGSEMDVASLVMAALL
jgi:hypothetical protein